MQINVYELMRIFIEIVESGSFSQTSENLQIHRPAVTRAIKQLEQHTGVRLLHRTTRRITLTPEGEEFYRSSKPLLEQTDALLGSFVAGRSLCGQLRVDMPVSIAAMLVVPGLPDFYRHYPGIEVVLSSSDRRKDMLRDGLDCIVRVVRWKTVTMWLARWVRLNWSPVPARHTLRSMACLKRWTICRITRA